MLHNLSCVTNVSWSLLYSLILLFPVTVHKDLCLACLGCTRYNVNDLPDHIDSGDVDMYAGDTTFYCIDPNVDQVISSLYEKMKHVLMWSAKNQPTIHPIKTEAMILKKRTLVLFWFCV